MGTKNLAPSAVVPSVEEGVCFDFRSGNKYAAVEFLNEGSIGFTLSPSEGICMVKELDESQLGEAADRIREFISETT